MFRLANFGESHKEEGSLYRYLSNAVSATITDCLNEYLEDTGKFGIFYDTFFGGDFFSEISRYIKLRAAMLITYDEDAQAGYEFTLLKMKRMRDKMQDQAEFYTFDVFEERILFLMCKVMEGRVRTAKWKQSHEDIKAKVEAAKAELREKHGLSAKRANDYSRKMYYASAMLLKEDEDDNLIFWDDDYDFYWRDGFVKGIGYLKELEGQNAGYGYQYACAIFSDIGINPPLMLLGTEEANRLVTEVQADQFRKNMEKVFGHIKSVKSPDDAKKRIEDDDDLPFN